MFPITRDEANFYGKYAIRGAIVTPVMASLSLVISSNFYTQQDPLLTLSLLGIGGFLPGLGFGTVKNNPYEPGWDLLDSRQIPFDTQPLTYLSMRLFNRVLELGILLLSTTIGYLCYFTQISELKTPLLDIIVAQTMLISCVLALMEFSYGLLCSIVASDNVNQGCRVLCCCGVETPQSSLGTTPLLEQSGTNNPEQIRVLAEELAAQLGRTGIQPEV